MSIVMPKVTSKCQIRDYQENDIPIIADIEFDPITKHYIGVPKGTKESWIDRASLDLLHGWAIVVLPEAEVAGRVCIERSKDRTPGVGELEIVIAKKFWGRGLGREVASLMIPAAFNEMDAKSLRGEVHPENRASLKLLKGFGFKYKCEAEKKPMLLYELNRDEFYL